MRSKLEIQDIPISTGVDPDDGEEVDCLDEPPIPVGLERVLGMAAVNPAFSTVLLEQPEQAIRASGVELVPAERAALRSADKEAIETMVGSLGCRLAETERRAFLDWAGRALLVLTAGGVAGCANQKRKNTPLGETEKKHSRGFSPEATLVEQRVPEEEHGAPVQEVPMSGARRQRPYSIRGSLGCRIPYVEASEPSDAGSRMRAAIRSRTGRLRHCYDLARKVDSKLQGTVKLSFVAGEHGRVSRVQVSSRLGGGLVECIRKRVSTWRLPKVPYDTKIGPITLIFSPANRP